MSAISGTFTSVGTTPEFAANAAGTVTINCTNGVGSVNVERAVNASRSAWKVEPVHTRNLNANGVIVFQASKGDVFRLNCIAYSSGTYLFSAFAPEDVSNVAPADGPIGGRLGFLGDSISANGGTDTGPNVGGLRTMPSNGYVNWLAHLSGQLANVEPGLNFSLAGRTTADIATQVFQMIRARPTMVIVEGGTNDPGNVLTPAQTIANLTYIYKTLTAAGIRIVAIPVTPRTTPNNYSSTQNAHLAQINRFIRQYAQNHGNVIVADPRYLAYLGLGTGYMNLANGSPSTGVTSDGLHPNPVGAKIWGTAVWTAIKPLIASTDIPPLWYDPLDLYDATWNPTGNMLTNGNFQTTTGGTLTDATGYVTGSVPGSWTAIFTPHGTTYTGTLAISNVVRTDLPGNLCRLTATSMACTGGSGIDKLQLFQQQNFPTGLNPGDIVEVSAEIRVNATAGHNGFDLNMGCGDGSAVQFTTVMGPSTTSASWPQGTYVMVSKTQKYLVPPPAGGTARVIQAFIDIYFDTTVAVTCVIDVASVSFRKVLPV